MRTFSVFGQLFAHSLKTFTSCLQVLYFEYNRSFALSFRARQVPTARHSSCKLNSHALLSHNYEDQSEIVPADLFSFINSL
jgi:hypothetical protein